MGGGEDPCRAVYVQVDVVVLCDRGLAGVVADADPHVQALGPGPRSERPWAATAAAIASLARAKATKNASPVV
jgi:hypothetical protein